DRNVTGVQTCALPILLGQHLGIIHLVDMVAGKDQKVIGTVIVNKVNVLGNSICGSAVNIQIGICFFTGRQNKNTAVLRVQSPTRSEERRVGKEGRGGG